MHRRRWTAAVLVVGTLALALSFWSRTDDPDATAAPARASSESANGITLQGRTSPKAPDSSTQASPASSASAPAPGPFWNRETAKPRITVRGRLLEPDGSPAAGAWVSVTGFDPSAPDSWSLSPSQRATTDGTFEVRIEQAHMVHLWTWGTQSAPLRVERPLPVGSDVDLGEIRLPQGATLSGRVRASQDSTPSAPARLLVSRAGCRSGFGVGPVDGRSITFEDGRLVSMGCFVATHDDGTWEATGLTPGAYAVHVLSLDGAWIHTSLSWRTRREVVAPADDIDFDLDCSVTWLEVVGLMQQSIPWYRAEFTDESGGVMAIREGQDQLAGSTGGTSLGVVLPANAAVELRVVKNGFLPHNQRVLAPPAGGSTRLQVQLVPAAQGRLLIDAAEPWRSERRTLSITLLEPGTQRRVHQETQPCGPAGASLRVPEGRWDLLLEDVASASGGLPSFALPQRTDLTVTPDEDTHATWAPPLGGRFSIELLPADDASREVRCEIEPASGPRERVMFRVVFRELNSAFSIHTPVESALHAGLPYEASKPFRAGPVTLVLTASGRRPLRLPVVLEAGKVVALQATLEAE